MDRNGKVVIGYCSPGEVRAEWHESVLSLVAADSGRRIAGWVGVVSSANIAGARNKIVEQFLGSPHEWLLMVDTDMVFEPEAFERLLSAADPQRAPILGGLCFGHEDGRLFPTLYDLGGTPEDPQVLRYGAYPLETVFQVFATGAAFLLVHRSALERIRDFRQDGRPFSRVFPWFQETTFRDVNGNDLMPMSEDVTFCWRAGVSGLPVHVHTGARVGHVKTSVLTEQTYLNQIASVDFERVPPARDPVAVIVPVMHRPQNAAPFMASLKASDPTSLARVYAVADEGDTETIAAWRRAGAELIELPSDVLRGDAGTFAEKANWGYEVTGDLDAEPWLLLVGDDVRFEPGWLDHAQQAARAGAHVIGTNDLHNPRVTAGEHATHLMIRRSYVDAVGASWDGPKVVCHEGYGHWWVDEEIVTAAKQRGAWAFAADARIEHLHPLWGLAEDDEVYQLGWSRAEADEALFKARLAEHGPAAAVNAEAFG